MPVLGWEVPLCPLCTMNGESLCLHNSTPQPGALESSRPTPPPSPQWGEVSVPGPARVWVRLRAGVPSAAPPFLPAVVTSWVGVRAVPTAVWSASGVRLTHGQPITQAVQLSSSLWTPSSGHFPHSFSPLQQATGYLPSFKGEPGCHSGGPLQSQPHGSSEAVCSWGPGAQLWAGGLTALAPQGRGQRP